MLINNLRKAYANMRTRVSSEKKHKVVVTDRVRARFALLMRSQAQVSSYVRFDQDA
ncbi:hypothetical protein X777_11549 [Ooceraea biroi]|uniref:Uncharacterized protein n=1 Tax=Ooceraea biroi TaxID=2015173 RepID=A0A026W3E9_OOCBI|nr:hypothetical protein X777_11549 [Ooceraea biroi]